MYVPVRPIREWAASGRETPQATAAIATPPPAASTPAPEPTPVPTPTPTPTPFALAWISDTQHYAGSRAEVLNCQYGWIAEARDRENIVALVHTGDIVQDCSSTAQWENVRAADALLPSDLLRVTAAGNHDIGADAAYPMNYLTYLTDTQIAEGNQFLGGLCRYVTLDAGGIRLLLLSIAYLHETDSIEWACQVLKEHPGCFAILLAHSYLMPTLNGGHRDGYTSGGAILRDNVVRPSPNLRMVLCGHTRGSVSRPLFCDDDGDGVEDRQVYQLLLNFQDEDSGMAGFLRLIRFDTAAGRIEVTTYSPYEDRFGYPGDPLGAIYVIEDVDFSEYIIRAS